jgi:transcriptional regulator GlxA family with amidase domain
VPVKRIRGKPPEVRPITLLAFDDAQILDIAGPLEVFACADRWLRRRGIVRQSVYPLRVVAAKAGPVTTMTGVALHAAERIDRITGGIDTLLVAGGDGVDAARADRKIIAWLQRMASQVRRLASVCNGALLLAEAGLLNGRRATTHWSDTAELHEQFPEVAVEPDRIYVQDGHVYTSGGVTAGMDLALRLVEQDFGRDIALLVAKRLVLFLRRPGGQSQFSHFLPSGQRPGLLSRVREHVLMHPEHDLSVGTLAGLAAMSPRNFARAFVRETGMTPGKFVELVRVEAAKTKLEQTRLPIDAVARACGFAHPERMRRAFHRQLAVGPSGYRERFSADVE